MADDPLRSLRFIRQLIRLGHDLALEVVVEGLETPGLIEAAMILGADLGQGYALARPMPPAMLGGWLAHFHRQPPDARRPRTALGALAGALQWEEQFSALPPDPASWQRHARARCATGSYLQVGSALPALAASHDAMHAAAVGGPQDAAFRLARARFLDQLVAHAQAQEQQADRSASASPD